MHDSAACQEFEDLPPLLQNTWLFDPRLDLLDAEQLKESDISTSELCKHYLQYRLSQHQTSLESISRQRNHPASLTVIVARKLRSILASCENLDEELETLLKSANSSLLRHIFGRPETPYVLLRKFMAKARALEKQGISTHGSNLLDVDEMVLKNTRHIRSLILCGDDSMDEANPVQLEDLCNIVGDDPSNSGEVLRIRRRDPPKGGFETIDYLRPRTLEILRNNLTFQKAFDWVTTSVLNGLDWNNVLAAGPFVLSTLMLTKPNQRSRRRTGCDMIELYLHGLNAQEANAKVEHIYNVWTDNLPFVSKLVTKHPCSIIFYTKKHYHSIRIHFRLYRSPIHVLTSQDLDPLAIGYAGGPVVMLPRCARALETGYSTFTTDLVHGDAAIGRRPTTMHPRLFKLANRGFGLRILPSYINTLKNSRHFFHSREKALSMAKPQNSRDGPTCEYMYAITEPRYATCISSAEQKPTTHEEYRKPTGDEPGLKTLNRIAFLGQDFAARYFFGAAGLSCSLKRTPTREQLERNEDLLTQFEMRQQAWEIHNTLRVSGEPLLGPVVGPFWLLRLEKMIKYGSRQDALDSLDQFEIFMRSSEVWRLYVAGLITLPDLVDPGGRRNSLTTCEEIFTSYDAPLFHPRGSINVPLESMADTIEEYNDIQFDSLQEGICRRVGIPIQRRGYRNYLTRRIRLAISGDDLQTVMEKPLSIPLAIPAELEDFIRDNLLPSIPNLPRSYTHKRILVPIHNPQINRASTTVPSLADSRTEIGNLRYRIINNENLWAGQHPFMDELSELYDAIHFSQSTSWPRLSKESDTVTYSKLSNRLDAADRDFIVSLANILRRRVVAPAPSSKYSTSSSDIDQTEKFLFQAWILADAAQSRERTTSEFDKRRKEKATKFDENDYLYPIPESAFWRDGTESQWPDDYVPDWIEAPPAKEPEATAERLQDSMRRDDSLPEPTEVVPESTRGFEQRFVLFSDSPTKSRRTFAGLELEDELDTEDDDISAAESLTIGGQDSWDTPGEESESEDD